MMTFWRLLISFGLLSISSANAQTTMKKEQEKLPQEETGTKENMKGVYNLINGMEVSGNTITPLQSLPWKSEARKILSYEDLASWINKIRLKREYNYDESRMYLITQFITGVGIEGMQAHQNYLKPAYGEVKDRGPLTILTEPVKSIGALRVKLISRLHDAKGKSIGFNTRNPFYFLDTDLRDADKFYNKKIKLSFSLDTVYSAVAGGYVEMQLLATQRYRHILVSAADTATTEYKIFDSAPFRVRLFEADKLLISSYPQYSDTIDDTWKYICMINGEPVKASFNLYYAGRYENVLTISKKPGITFDECWEIMNADKDTDSKEWGKFYRTGVDDMDQVYFYKPIPDDKSVILASVCVPWEDKQSEKTYLNEKLWEELEAHTLLASDKPQNNNSGRIELNPPLPDKKSWTEAQRYSYYAGVASAMYVSPLRFPFITFEDDYAILPQESDCASRFFEYPKGKVDFRKIYEEGVLLNKRIQQSSVSRDEIDAQILAYEQEDPRKAFYLACGYVSNRFFKEWTPKIEILFLLKGIEDEMLRRTIINRLSVEDYMREYSKKHQPEQ